MLTRQCLRHIERLSLEPFYRDRAFVVSRDFRQAGDVGIRPEAGQFRWRSRAVESSRASLWVDRQHVWLSTRFSAGGQGQPFVAGSFRPTRFLHRLWLCGRQRLGSIAFRPVHKMLLDRDPVTGFNMASQPTLSRFENAVGPRQLYGVGAALAESVIERHAAVAPSRPTGHHRS